MTTEQRVPSEKFSLSIMSFLPHTLIPGYGIKYLLRMMKVSEYDGIHLDPLWTLYENALCQIDFNRVLSIKPSWRGNWYDDRTDWCRIRKGELPDLLMDIALFGTRRRVKNLEALFRAFFPNAVQIDMKQGGVLQLSENHNRSPEEWRRYSGGIELHSWHIRHFPNPEFNPYGIACNARECLEFVGRVAETEGLVRQLHFQIREQEELSDFLAEKKTFTQCFAEAVRPSGIARQVPILVSVSFGLLPWTFWKRAQIFRILKSRLRSILFG